MTRETLADGFEKIVEFVPGWAKWSDEPSKNYGFGCVTIRFVLKGPNGAMQFVVSTGLFPDAAWDHWEVRNPEYRPKPYAVDIGYHAKTAQYDGQSVCQESCPYVDGAPCYYDGTSLGASDFLPTFIESGDDAVWAMLRQKYNARFGVKP